VWGFSFDELRRLSTATNAAAGRKIEFQWDRNNRIAGRTAYQSDGGSKKMRQFNEAPVRVMMKPAELIATTGE